MTPEDQLKRISQKLQQLLKRYEWLQKENEKLKSELVPYKQKETQYLEHIARLEQTLMVMKTSTGKMDEADKKELDKKLNGYLKEIERCIAMLGN